MHHTLIETPSPSAPTQVWRDFLKRVEAMDPRDLGVHVAIEEARKTIDLHEKMDWGEKIEGPHILRRRVSEGNESHSWAKASP